MGIEGYVSRIGAGTLAGGGMMVAVSTNAAVDFGGGPKGQVADATLNTLVARYDAAGKLLTADRLDGTSDVRLWDFTTAGGSPVLLGSFYDTLKIGDETLVSEGGNSLFVARLGP
jgi:hypothetical protein